MRSNVDRSLIGLGPLPAALSIAVVGGVPAEREGEAASLLTTGQQVGAAVVIAVLAVVAEGRTAAGGGLSTGFSLAFLVSAALMVVAGFVVALTLPRAARRDPGRSTVPAPRPRASSG